MKIKMSRRIEGENAMTDKERIKILADALTTLMGVVKYTANKKENREIDKAMTGSAKALKKIGTGVEVEIPDDTPKGKKAG